jgi:hypothetical protein
MEIFDEEIIEKFVNSTNKEALLDKTISDWYV